MTNSPSQSAVKTSSNARLGVIAGYRRALRVLRQINTMLKTPEGEAVSQFCRKHNTYVPISPPVKVGQNFSDGIAWGMERVQVIAATRSGIGVRSSYKTIETRPEDMLGAPLLEGVPGLRALHLVRPLALAIDAGFTLDSAQRKLQQAAQKIRDGASPVELRMLY